MAIKLGKYYLTRNNPRYLLRRIAELENQQKEFIEYLEEPIKIITDGLSLIHI